MQKSKIRVTILTIAAVLTATVILAIACAPAEPTPKATEKKLPNLTRTQKTSQSANKKPPYRVELDRP